MSVKLAMEGVNRLVPIRMALSSAHVIQDTLWELMAPVVKVESSYNIIHNKLKTAIGILNMIQ